jgi:hypothetical protein
MIEQIENIEKLADALGSNEFYDFHDCEIVSIGFDRKDSITLEVTLRIHRKISEFVVGSKIFDHYKNFDATFKFSKIRLLNLNGFGHQNVIDELSIIKDKENFIVHFIECYGCDLKFECERMALTGIEISETEQERFIPDYKKIKVGILVARNRENK